MELHMHGWFKLIDFISLIQHYTSIPLHKYD
jgi:hypothetical protein